ncbi:cilia- and flagella-associated protein 69-like [Conger conger]|uniref:cilia- and flagella-associated protein 69-like n=1 Tax=Conger conger TaxID=82655 RepID=UPI002A5AEE47|nr:cilia- and flagella-associated protein 69-like [Conger conger]
MELNRVIHILEDPFSNTLEERHLFVLKKMVKRYQNGFLLKEIADVFKILNLCVEKAEDHSQYTLVMCDILKICGLPLLKEKTSDEMYYATVVQESLSQMGYLMRVPSADVRLQICSSITSFFGVQKSRAHVEGFCPVSLGFRVQMVEQSGVAEILVLSMALLENQVGVRLHVLKTLQILSNSSVVNCSKMVKAQGASKICSHMSEPDPWGQLLFRSLELLWNMLEKGGKDEATSQLSNMDCITALKDALQHQFLNAFQQADQQLRNDLLVIITLIADNPNAPLIESGLAKLLVLFATFPEIKSHNPLVRNLKLSFNYEDFEMKRLLLNAIVVMSRDISSLQLFKEGQVLSALLLHLNPGERSGVPGWTPVQQGELQLHALATMQSVAPLLLEDYVTCQGNTLLLLLMDRCTKQGQTDACSGQGGWLGNGVTGDTKAQLHGCVRVLRAMVSLGSDIINQDLCDQGAITQFLETLMQLESSNKEEAAITIEIMTDLQQILSLLCENDLHRKELFGSGGVDMLVHFLKTSSGKFYSGLGHNKLVLSTVDCVWSCVVGCDTTEDIFLEKEGVFLLLDLLHSGPGNMHGVVLGTLLELCDNPKTLSHVHTWRGPKGLTVAALLLLLWRQEERELWAGHDRDMSTADSTSPRSVVDDVDPVPADRPTAVVVDVSDSLQSKIYSVFSKLGFEDLPGLTTEDNVTLSIVRKYLDFKVMEAWVEIAGELRAEGVRPVTPDEEALEAIGQMAGDTTRTVALRQAELRESQKQQDIQQEQLMYTEIRFNHKQQELVAKSWEHHVAKTSDYKVLMESRDRQEKSIQSSRSKARREDSLFHSTQIAGLRTTHFCGHVLSVESTPVHLVGGPLANTDLALQAAPIRGGALQAHPARASELEHFHRSSVPAK